MIVRLIGCAAAFAFVTAGTGYAQQAPAECAAPTSPDAVRLALLVTDVNGIPFAGIGRVAVRGAAVEPSDQIQSGSGFIEYWYCSPELPRGRYTVEVRTLSFDCTAISLPESESGLVVRMVRLRPDPWRPPPRGRYAFAGAYDQHQVLAAALSSRRCGVSAG